MNRATLQNLKRKSAFVDTVQLHNGIPLPSWIDLNLTELCNRACVFCPRADADFYPNQELFMSVDLVASLARELEEIGFAGCVSLCGFGEPMLHPRIVEIVSAFSPLCRVELVTNGDQLTPYKVMRLCEAGLSYFVVSLYDGPHQVDQMHKLFRDAGCGEEAYLLRDRWHGAAEGFGLKLTNRAGTIDIGDQAPIDTAHPCHYLAYQLTVDWNGDVLLCPQDWNKRVKYGNLATQSLLEVWTSPAMQKRRTRLLDGKRTEAPCSGCNTEGTLHGADHVQAWRRR